MTRIFEDKAADIVAAATEYMKGTPIPGLASPGALSAFARQCVDSLRRVHFVKAIQERDIDPRRADPTSLMFDPIRAAVLHLRAGDVEEATWLVFLSTHFGRHRKEGWMTTAQVYRGAGTNDPWTYTRVSTDLLGFLAWLDDPAVAVARFVGNHRKYVSMSARKPNGTGDTISSYVEWVNRFGSQESAMQVYIDDAEGDEYVAFRMLYDSLRAIRGFGRTARFDLLCMLQKVGIADIAPDRAYLEDSTGPLRGAALLLRGNAGATRNRRKLDDALCDFGAALGLTPNLMEDAVCNWQKDPNRYVPFRG